ncbi:TerD family protein [Rhodococcus aerolatus]
MSGQNITLPTGARRVQALVSWVEGDSEQQCEVELSALLLGESGKVRADEDMVFYNQPESADGAVRYQGVATREDGVEARVSIDLESLDATVATVALVASIDPGTFGSLASVVVSLVDPSTQALARFVLPPLSQESAVHLCDVYRRHGGWRLRAVGQGWSTGLAGLATDFGITVDEDTPDTSQSATDVEPPAPPVAVPTDVEATPPAPPRRRRGVRTARPKPIVIAPPQLADDPSWQAARLFPVAGIGAADEQESRATSALLATMVAVKRFGRSITAHLGAPAGSLETFLEVPFKHGETTSRPDGVLKVARAGTVWTALVEVKTGAGQLRAEQIERYLDVARLRGYDSVVTISNEIAQSRGAHPVPVDGRKLRKVTLHHLSWAEVLHEARMLLAHRGSDDPLQAWITHEFIRYLEHPRSGADLFQDMGPAWVPVRQAVAAGTLRPTDSKVPPVAAAWGKLVTHLRLQLTSELGVEVKEVLPRGPAGTAEARLAGAVALLASDGVLRATMKIPGAAGPLTVVADVRTTQVRVSVEVDAPGEGGPQRRVGWVVRQLKDAPPALLVEVAFAGSADSTCEQLKDVRDSVAPLVLDRTTEVKKFTLTLAAPLGTKRSGVKGGFVSSVVTAVEGFYREVVQPIKPWVPSAPRLPAEPDVPADDGSSGT